MGILNQNQNLKPDRTSRPWWAAAWAMVPVRAFLIALFATGAIWGRFLLPSTTLSMSSEAPTINRKCRVGTAELVCQAPYAPRGALDPGGPAWQNYPADYFFHNSLNRGELRPHWNPYICSGYPIVMDGHTSALSPAQWFTVRFPGDQGHDIVAFVRFLLWTFAIVWTVGICGASSAVLLGIAAAAALAPYAAVHVDIAFLDADLLSPWFLLILVAFMNGQLSLWRAIGASLVLGAVVGTMPFPQAPFVLGVAMGLLSLAAAPATRGRSLILAAGLGGGLLVALPSWLMLANNLDQFISSRDVICISEQGLGLANTWRDLIHPPFLSNWVALFTLVGAGLLLFTPWRWWFIVISMVVFGIWERIGLPHAACSLPVVSGVRFSRHLLPHFQMLFIFTVGISAQALSQRISKKWPWIVFTSACTVAAIIAFGAEPQLRRRVIACTVVGAILGGVAAIKRRSWNDWHGWQSGAFAAGLILFAFPAYFFGSPMPSAHGAPQLEEYPARIAADTPLGEIQSLSQAEDRRHFSPSGYFYPNWSAAFDVMDMLCLYALYPIGYHELNSTLFTHWEGDPFHKLKPDRFTPLSPPSKTMSVEFQRVMAINRISLLTFDLGEAVFADTPSPYEASKCRLLSKSKEQGTEAYVCPEVGSVGFFPETVRTVKSRAEALEIMQRASPTELTRTALLGPEIDLSIGGAAAREVTAALGRVISVERRGDDLNYLLEVERDGVFVVADMYFRGWTATVNGIPAGISRVNVAFKAVRIPQGRVELKLHFAPLYWSQKAWGKVKP